MSILLSKILFRLFNLAEKNENTNMNLNGEKKILSILLNNYENFTFFDVGTNKGDYTQLIIDANTSQIKLNGHLFEPLKELNLKLKMRFKKNNFIINNIACSDKIKTETFFSSSQQSHSSFYNWSGKTKKIKIKTTTLLNYIKKNKVSKINLLKIDTEGHDLFVLNGLKNKLNNKQIDFIQFEYGIPNISSKTYLKDFYEILTKKGFIIGKIMPNNIELRNYSHYMENFHNSNYLAISKKIINKKPKIKNYLRGNINLIENE